MHGKGVYLTQDGVLYEGDFKNGLKDGFGVEKFNNEIIFTGLFERG